MLTVLGVLLLFEPCVALEAKPAIPTFTIQEISQPYDVSPTTTTSVDPYTGEEKIITYPGYTVENKTVYIVIKNQPFTPYKNDKGETMHLYYEYHVRGHYIEGEGGWSLPQPQYYEQSDSEYTLILFKGLPSSGKVDVEVRALIGTLTSRPPLLGFESGDGFYYRFEGIEGEYSTITVSSSDLITSTALPSSSSPSNVLPSTTLNTPSSSEFHNSPVQNPWTTTTMLITIATVCVIVIPTAIIAYQYGKRKTKSVYATGDADCEVKT
jgi:hypothetical protein